MVCAPSEDSDQPGHPPSLIRVFAVRMKKAWSLATHRAHSKDSDQTMRMPRLIWVFAGRTCHFIGFIMRWFIIVYFFYLFTYLFFCFSSWCHCQAMFCDYDCSSSSTSSIPRIFPSMQITSLAGDSWHGVPITKTRLFKYIENFTAKNWKFADKNSDIFHISAQNIDCRCSLEPLRRGGSNGYPQSMF